MDFAAARQSMVRSQIRTNRITDPLLIEALSQIERERFLPPALRGIAYVDECIPLGQGRFLLEPLTTALLLQAAEIDGDDVVLDVGAGPGYGSAIAAKLASTVVALECDHALAEIARDAFKSLEIDTVSVVEGELKQGCTDQAPYDVIFFSGAVAQVPEAIMDQLAEGGRLVAVVMEEQSIGRGCLFLRQGGTISRRPVFDAVAPLLPGFAPEQTFRF